MIESNYSGIPDTPQNPNKRKILFIIVGVVVFVLLVGVIVFFVHKNKKQSTTVVTSPESFVTNTPPVVVDPFPNDADRDGIDDQKEKELGLSNRNFDTDGDSLSDADEIDVWKTDPKKKDTDGDTFSDGYEVIKGYNPNGDGKLPQ